MKFTSPSCNTGKFIGQYWKISSILDYPNRVEHLTAYTGISRPRYCLPRPGWFRTFAGLVGAMMGKASFGGAFVGIVAAMILLVIGLLV